MSQNTGSSVQKIPDEWFKPWFSNTCSKTNHEGEVQFLQVEHAVWFLSLSLNQLCPEHPLVNSVQHQGTKPAKKKIL